MGRKMQHDFEVYGSKGALVFSQERFNELHFYSAGRSRPAGVAFGASRPVRITRPMASSASHPATSSASTI